jgi:hypothetical protein
MRLPNSVDLHPDEPPISLASRLAAANGFTSLGMLARLVGITPVAIARGEPAAMETLADLSGFAVADVSRYAMRPSVNGRSSLGGCIVPKSTLLYLPIRRICPRCIEADLARGSGLPLARPYQRHQWQTSEIEVCGIHEVELVPVATPKHLEHDFARFVQTYGPDIHAAAATSVPRALPPAQKYIGGRLGGVRSNPFLDQLELYVVVETCKRFAAFMRQHGDDSDLSDLELGYEVARGGPAALEMTVVRLIAKAKPNNHTINKFFGRLLTWLRGHKTNSDMALVIELLQDIAVRNLPFTDKDIFVHPVKAEIQSVSMTSKEFGLPKEFVRDVLSKAGVITDRSQRASATWFSAAAARPYLEAVVPAMRDYDVGGAIGVPSHLAKTLRTSGIIPETTFAQGTHRRSKVHPASLAKFVETIFEGVQEADGDHKLMNLVDATSHCLCGFEEMVRLVLGRRLRSLRRVGDGTLLTDLVVDCTEAADVLAAIPGREILAELKKRTVGVTRAATELQTTTQTVRALVASGQLAARELRNVVAMSRSMYVDRNSLAAFAIDHVSLSGLAKELGRQPAEVEALLAAQGVVPANDASLSREPFFRRADLECIL